MTPEYNEELTNEEMSLVLQLDSCGEEYDKEKIDAIFDSLGKELLDFIRKENV